MAAIKVERVFFYWTKPVRLLRRARAGFVFTFRNDPWVSYRAHYKMWTALAKRNIGKKDENESEKGTSVCECVCTICKREYDEGSEITDLYIFLLQSKKWGVFNWVSEMKCHRNTQLIDFTLLYWVWVACLFEIKTILGKHRQNCQIPQRSSRFEQGMEMSLWICLVIAKHHLNRAWREWLNRKTSV